VLSGRTNNFPESRRGLGHVNHTTFGSTVGYPSDSLASCLHTGMAVGQKEVVVWCQADQRSAGIPLPVHTVSLQALIEMYVSVSRGQSNLNKGGNWNVESHPVKGSHKLEYIGDEVTQRLKRLYVTTSCAVLQRWVDDRHHWRSKPKSWPLHITQPKLRNW